MESLHGPDCQCSKYKIDQNDDNINQLVELNELICFNEKIKNSCKKLFPEESQKYLNESDCISFDNDPELVFYIRFKEELNLRAINFIAVSEMFPLEANLYLNQENVSFDIIEEEPDFHFECHHFTPRGEIEIYPNVLKCSNLRTIVLHFRGNAKNVGLNYIGLKGFSQKGKRFIVQTNYELVNTEKSKFGEKLDNLEFIGK
jgi:hypothetical protein